MKLQSNVFYGYSLVNLLHIFRTPFLKNTSGRSLLFVLFFEKMNISRTTTYFTKREVYKRMLNYIVIKKVEWNPHFIAFCRWKSMFMFFISSPFSPKCMKVSLELYRVCTTIGNPSHISFKHFHSYPHSTSAYFSEIISINELQSNCGLSGPALVKKYLEEAVSIYFKTNFHTCMF